MIEDLKCLECAAARAAFWRKLAHAIETADPVRAARLEGMAAGAAYVIADHRYNTNPTTLRAGEDEWIAAERRRVGL